MRRRDKAKWCLVGCLITVLVLAGISVFMPAKLTNAVKLVADNDFASRLRTLPVKEADQERRLIEMVVEVVGVSQIDYQPVAILKEKEGELYLPIVIGLLEADAISVILEGVKLPRPLTADLLCSVIDKMGAGVSHITINDLKDGTFYAKITLKANWQQMEVDARPSDAIAIALRVRAPIFVEKAVLDKAGTPGAGQPKV